MNENATLGVQIHVMQQCYHTRCSVSALPSVNDVPRSYLRTAGNSLCATIYSAVHEYLDSDTFLLLWLCNLGKATALFVQNISYTGAIQGEKR